ncbi:MAG TPA: hypothetical protein VKD47_04275 [Miltoncostaeaceae bacterium]|nr:hypothetical protein [Miltoncostaeaceae bacterium]
MALYFGIGYCQPFADMSTDDVEGFPGVEIVRADGTIVGLRMEDARTVLRLPELIDLLDLDAERIWARLKADDDVLVGRRQATWGGGGA